MAIKMNQAMKQSQNLTMTPQLQQAIKLLTLTHLEMTNVIAEEMVENPMLEELGPSEEKPSEDDYKLERLEDQNKESSAENLQEDNMMGKDDFDWQSYIDSFESSSSSSPPSMVSSDPDDAPNYENMVSQGQTLADHLDWQLRMSELSREEYELAELIIHNINDDGYLESPFEDIVAQSKLSISHAREVLDRIQRLDPVGCGTENLIECLLIQAKIAEETSPLLERIICDHLEDLKGQNYEVIAEATGVSVEAVKSAALRLQNFHPKPGRLVVSQDTHYIVPDIYVKEVAGEFVVQVNDDGVPRLKISKLYRDMIKNKGDLKAKEFVQEKLRSALWLIKSIHTRQNTIFNVAKSIVAQQQEFFKKGSRFLKPMVLRDVANEIGVHESTVSRVTTNKYMHTPIGLFELKYFFNSGIGGKNGGQEISNEVLKHKIKELVANENPKKPLSDQKIADLLSREDVTVARRTVAKYREILDIASSSKRKVK